MQNLAPLIAHLKANPGKTHVHFNAKGEWLFTPHPTYPQTETREAVLEAAAAAGLVETEDSGKESAEDLVLKLEAVTGQRDALLAQIGTLPEDVHPDELLPPGATWLEERANHLAENSALQEQLTKQQESNTSLNTALEQLGDKVKTLTADNDQLKKDLAAATKKK